MAALKTILITNDPALAQEAETAGVSRIMVDLESLGKKERQASRNTFISSHAPEDVAKIRAVLKSAELIVRINPWHSGSPGEIAAAVAAGVGRLMLPMITDMAQFDAFIVCLKGRAKPLPLVETAYSMEHIAAIAAHPAVDELYIGLNDLHLSLGLDFLFEPLALGLLDRMAETIRAHGKPFGFGGIAAIGGGELPAERILGEHARLGSSCVILSSRFGKDIHIDQPEGRKQRLAQALAALHNAWQLLGQRTLAQQQDDKTQTFAMIKTLADNIRKRKTA